ncbi:MAG: hypothetical protein V3T72_06545 [Thermoanaerobaculia bacterium]
MRSSLMRALWLVFPALLLATACFDIEQPVDERLRLIFLADGGLRLQLSVELRHPGESRSDTGLGRRLRQLEEELLSGWDPWKRRFGDVEASVENFYWEKEEGRLVYAERNLILDDPAALGTVLADTPIHGTFRVDDGVAEVALFPGVPGRATRRERREMDEVLDKWSEEIATYLQAAENLYRHLERQPDRAVPVFAALFEEEMGEDPLSPEEDALLEALGDSEVIEVLEVDAKRGYSLDELSRRVFDPFPARFEVEIPAPAVDAEGFVHSGDLWVVPGLSLWTALEELEGVWLAPDPMVAWVEHYRSSPDAPFDVLGYAARERVAEAADADEVREALEEKLTPAGVYRLAWQVVDDAAGSPDV